MSFSMICLLKGLMQIIASAKEINIYVMEMMNLERL